MATAKTIRDGSHEEWLAHVRPTGLVVAAKVLDERLSVPPRQTAEDNEQVEAALEAVEVTGKPTKWRLSDPWRFCRELLEWTPELVAGAPGGPDLPSGAEAVLENPRLTLRPDWVVLGKGGDPSPANWTLFVTLLPAGVGPDKRGALEGWEATPGQRMERLLRETGTPAGLLIGEDTIRLITVAKGESSGWMDFPVQALTEVAGRPMLAGLKLLLGKWPLWLAPGGQRLPELIAESRAAQANVSEALAGQVLAALHALLRGLTAAMPHRIGAMAADPARAHHLYEGLLTVLMRLVFLLYAEDRDLIPTLREKEQHEFYDEYYSVRGMLSKLEDDEARHPATMDDRRGAWGRLLALFRLVHAGDRYGWIQARGGKLFDPDAFPFFEGRDRADAAANVPNLADGAVLEVLRGLMRVAGSRLSYRTLDVEQIGSVYETVMGFTVEAAAGPSLAIRAGKKNRTPVFVDLAALLAEKPGERLKWLKAATERGHFPPAMEAAIRAAASIEELAAAFETGRGVVDERASPGRRIAHPGTPVLQPTDERRRTGSHYTPRSLTEPILRHALEPAFARLGLDATADQVLDLKVCDLAVGSGAFLVEACRQLGERLKEAWSRHPASRPTIPADEDETLFARRLVAQRCLYGVDRNPLATDLARLSLWLATLARDHEFAFVDHSLKSGDSLVGLTNEEIAAADWEPSRPSLPILRQIVGERAREALTARVEIQAAPDDVARLIQEQRHRSIETRLAPARQIGDVIVSAFFSEAKPRARESRRAEVESWLARSSSDDWAKISAEVAALRAGEHPIAPFHWRLEFPEVFARENPGFDAVVGNPPFAGKNTTIAGNPPNYLPWLQTLHAGAHGNSDLVAHFFRRAFGLLRQGGVFGLIATNTIGQGDTRATGLEPILAGGGAISRAVKRLKWPGEAAVVVSVVHVAKGLVVAPTLDGRPVSRVSAFLVEADLDATPLPLKANSRKAFVGSYVLGMGFTFDDTAAANGEASSLAKMQELINRNARNGERIFPYIGGEEVNTSPTHAHHRWVIDFENFPLGRREDLGPWASLDSHLRAECLIRGLVPDDYPDAVAEDWPDLIEIVMRLVKPQREKQGDKTGKAIWWRHLRTRPGLYRAITPLERVLCTSRMSPFLAISSLPAGLIYSEQLIVFSLAGHAPFAVLQSRAHELWARFFSSTMEDRLRYAPSDCFRTFPFPRAYQTNEALEAAGAAYADHRARLMVERNEGLTRTYNRFHDEEEDAADIARLRTLHAEMDRAVLAAYGWDDLGARAAPKFIPQDADEGEKAKTRLDWPAAFKDEVLARLLALNAERPHVVPGASGWDDEDDDDDETAEPPSASVRRRLSGVAEDDSPTFLFEDADL